MVPLQQSSMQLPRVLFIVYWKTNFVIEKHQSTSSTDHGWFPHWESEMLLNCWSSAVALTVLPRMPKSGSTPRQTFSTFLLRHRRRAPTFRLTLAVVSTQCCENRWEHDLCLPTISAASTTNAAAEEHPIPSLTSLPIPPTASFPSCIVGGDLAAPLDCWTPRQWDASAPSPP